MTGKTIHPPNVTPSGQSLPTLANTFFVKMTF
jgi:hypothetical protein